MLALAAAALVYGSLLAFRSPDFRGVVAYSSLAQSGLIALGLFSGTNLGLDGAVLQMVAHGLDLDLALPDRGRGRAADDDRRVRAARRDGARATGARDAADDRRRDLARRARVGLVRGRVPRPRRRVPARLVVGGDRRRRDRARRDVHAAADLRGAARGARLRRHRRRRSTCAPASSRSSCRSSPCCSRCRPGRPGSATTPSPATSRRVAVQGELTSDPRRRTSTGSRSRRSSCCSARPGSRCSARCSCRSALRRAVRGGRRRRRVRAAASSPRSGSTSTASTATG